MVIVSLQLCLRTLAISEIINPITGDSSYNAIIYFFSGGLTSGSLSAEMPDASGTQRRRDSINLFMASSALNHARHNMRGRIQKRKIQKGCKTRPSGI
uniref:Uncharacterized protein n=1 Tax=Raoultella planticola TaxID=575 RepID=W8CTA1_RAOPL|nr:hypothetical protein pKpNDM1_00269 [Raoultella planticola]